ncbi:HlyD family efflux transporter periplasmic adaptor subunit [Pseudomonas sp. NFXW11]|uniref:HlyD family efflux transporter periplasmic adaptor subunit n=1 Tax=Pseudomonas sp. NFXW11 TaxID=2819531 RepID=UPI003CEC1CE4
MHLSPSPTADQPDAANDGTLDALPLPPLRQDLRLLPAPSVGRPLAQAGAWRIYDPLKHSFYAIDHQVLDMLGHWSLGTLGAMRSAVQQDTGARPEDAKVMALIQFLQQHDLCLPPSLQGHARLLQRRTSNRTSLARRLLHHYLFFKVPLAHPDAFLRRTLPWVTLLFQPAFWWSIAALGVVGLYLVSRQWDSFLHTFPGLFSVSGAIAFGLSLALVKTLHELGHGYTAVRLGSRVTSMGVALVLMTPILYTDTTDAWRLPNRQRVLIDAAGMLVELLVAVLATLAWVFLPDSPWRSAAFALASTSWLLSLGVNLNPLMRFDGYYLFADLLGVPGLQQRAFAMARWWLREKLWDFGDEPPEPLDRRATLIFIGYAWATWVYRLFLFLGIALLVYHYFFKILGLFLFAVEIGWFIVNPIARELRIWLQRRGDAGRRAYLSLALIGAALAMLLVPLPYQVRVPAVLTAAQQTPVFAAYPARIDCLQVGYDQRVSAGQLLLTLDAPELDSQLQAARDRERLLVERLERRDADSQDLSQSLVLEPQLSLERDRIAGLQREQARLQIRAPVAGVVAQLASELSPGRWVDDKTQLLLIIEPQPLQARGYAYAEDLQRLSADASGHFEDEQHLLPDLKLRVSRIGAAANDTLENWILASTFGGEVASRPFEGQQRAEQSVFEVTAEVLQAPPVAPLSEVRGDMWLKAKPVSLASRVMRQVARVLLREAGA